MQELVRHVEARFPDLRGRVYGKDYPLPPLRRAAATAATAAQFGGLAFIVLGDTIFRQLGMRPPAALGQLRENRMALIGGYMALNMLSSSLGSSGAFEVYFGGPSQPLPLVSAVLLP